MPTPQTDAATLEQEVTEERSRIDETIDAIQQKLTPGQLLDEGIGFLKRDATGALADVVRIVSANPIPAALIGVGLVWLILASTPPVTPPGLPKEANTQAS